MLYVVYWDLASSHTQVCGANKNSRALMYPHPIETIGKTKEDWCRGQNLRQTSSCRAPRQMGKSYFNSQACGYVNVRLMIASAPVFFGVANDFENICNTKENWCRGQNADEKLSRPLEISARIDRRIEGPESWLGTSTMQERIHHFRSCQTALSSEETGTLTWWIGLPYGTVW